MSSSYTSKVVISLAAMTAPALADEATLLKKPYLELTADNQAADLELGLKLAPSDIHIRPYVRVPFSDADEKLLRIDRYSSTVKGGIGIDYVHDLTGPPGPIGTPPPPSRLWRVSLEAELGTKKFSFTPFGEDKQSERHQSFSLSLDWMYEYYVPKVLALAPQVAISYNRSYEEADKTSFVVPSTTMDPDIVDSRVIAPPSVAPELQLRVGTPFYDATSTMPLAFALYGVAALSGTGYTPWSEGQTFRGELWSYVFLASPASSRLGIALFAESRRDSADADRTNDVGVFVQLKLQTRLSEY